MWKRKRSDRASGRATRPSPESNDGRSAGEEFPSTPTPDGQSKGEEFSSPPTPDGQSAGEEFPSTPTLDGQSKGEELPSTPTPDGQPGTSTGQGPSNTLEESLAFLREVEEYFKDEELDKYKAFINLMVAQKREGKAIDSPCVISQVKELFRGHTEMLKLFNKILRPGYKILVKEDTSEIQDLAKLYMAKVKTRSLPSVYTTFLHILYLYHKRALTSDEVDQEVEVLFGDACDLLEEYDCFRPDRAAPVVQSPLHPRHSALEVSKLQREQQCERLQQMCEDVAKCKRKEKGKGIVSERKQQPQQPKRVSARLANAANTVGNRRSSRSSVEAHPRRPSRNAAATPAAGTQSRSRSRGLDNAKYNGRSMCTPSYLLLKPPKNGDGDGEVIGEVSVHRSELAKLVLNEECELVREGDSKTRTWNPHEKVLFKCERDQYECDIIWRKFKVTSESFMNYLLKLQGPNSEELPPVEEFMSAVHKRCIKELYGLDAPTFMATLKENPARALPVLLNRLVLKMEELKSYKATITPMWSQVYKDNFHLSLDHQSIDSQHIDQRSKVNFKNFNNLEANTSGLASASQSANPCDSISPSTSPSASESASGS